MNSRRWVALAVIFVILLGVWTVYANDSATVEHANVVKKYFEDYCKSHKRYPDYEQVAKQFPELFRDQDWYYWPNETLTDGTFQYPMTMPLSSAPGSSKYSEFLPVIYSYAVRHPCRDLIRDP